MREGARASVRGCACIGMSRSKNASVLCEVVVQAGKGVEEGVEKEGVGVYVRACVGEGEGKGATTEEQRQGGGGGNSRHTHPPARQKPCVLVSLATL
jgi:hypothetical protein